MIFPMEKILEKFDNKYKAINIVSMEARRLKDEQSKGLMDKNSNPVLDALKKLIVGKIKYKE